MPSVIDENTSGMISIRNALMKAWPTGSSSLPTFGHKRPKTHPTTRPISICTGNGIPNIEPLARGSDCTEAEVDVIVLPLVLQQHWVGQLNRRRVNLSGLPNRI